MLLNDNLDLNLTLHSSTLFSLNAMDTVDLLTCIYMFAFMCLCVFVCCSVFEFDTLLFGCIWLCVIFCWRLMCVCACMWECLSLSLRVGSLVAAHIWGGCSSTPRHAPSAPSGCGRTKPVHFHIHVPAGRILIIISPMMRHCDALHSRSLSQFLFFLSLFLLFTFMVSEEKRKEENEGDFNLILLFAKISAIFLLQSQIKVILWHLLFLFIETITLHVVWYSGMRWLLIFQDHLELDVPMFCYQFHIFAI